MEVRKRVSSYYSHCNVLMYMQRNQTSDEGRTEYGFAFLDYAALKFWVGSITDDDSCATLGALLVQVNLFFLTLKQVSSLM